MIFSPVSYLFIQFTGVSFSANDNDNNKMF